MLRIALCDDDEHQLYQTAVLLRSYFQSHPNLNGQLETFQSGKTLLERIENAQGFDLYILDILLPELNGIETGQHLRALGETGEIVYLTNFNNFAADSYDVGAFFYLLKPVTTERLFQILDRVVEKRNQRQISAVIVNTASGCRRILPDQIRYMERVGRRIRYFCTDRTLETQSIRVSFRTAAAPLLADRRFYLCGASIVLNFQHVTGVKGQSAILDNGQIVALPRTAAMECKKAWGDYWLEGICQ